MPEIIIHKSGALSTIQDGGRLGYQAFGVPVSGAMDLRSLHQANLLVDNDINEACLEVTLTGPEIEFNASTYIALVGADMTALLNWRPAKMYETIMVETGDTLRFGELVSGVRLYIALNGGFDIPKIMGSKSTCLKGTFGGFKGRALIAGDRINYSLPIKVDQKLITADEQFINIDNTKTVRFIAGPESHQFDNDSLAKFISSTYTISHECDRMGIRLNGTVLKHKGSADIISSPVSCGTVQIPGNGKPIILMADAQTTGGYTRIAQIISADIPLLAQMKPGDRLKFTEVSLDQV